MSAIVVAVAGGTGTIGVPISRALLSSAYYPHSINRVVVLSRNPTSPVAEELKKLGAEIESRSISDPAVLKGVDVLVNAMAFDVATEIKNTYVQAAVDAGVKVYFASEYGADHYSIHFEHPVFVLKEHHMEHAKEVGGDKLKIVALCTGPFLSSTFLIGPMVGLDVKERHFSSIGPANQKIAFTELDDVASSVARLSILAVQDPTSVPEVVRVVGDSTSYSEMATIFEKELGEKIKITLRDPKEVEANLDPNDIGGFIGLTFAIGVADFSKQNDNELVNPGQKYWKWKTVADFAKETKGNPPTL